MSIQIAEQLSWLEEHQVRSKLLPLLMQWDLCHRQQVCMTQQLLLLPLLLNISAMPYQFGLECVVVHLPADDDGSMLKHVKFSTMASVQRQFSPHHAAGVALGYIGHIARLGNGKSDATGFVQQHNHSKQPRCDWIVQLLQRIQTVAGACACKHE